MLSVYEAYLEVPDEGVQPFELVKLARKNNLIKKREQSPGIILKDNEYLVKRIDKGKNKKKLVNPLTGRLKGKKVTSFLKTTVPPEERTLKNLPRLATKKSKVKFQDWLMLKNTSKSKHSVGQAPNGTWYGWSHRAVGSFNIGKKITSDTIGRLPNTPYIIKTEEEAFKHADRFAKEVS